MSNTPYRADQPNDLIVKQEEDWDRFSAPDLNLDVIVDPMVFRSGHVLLNGRSRAQASSTTKDADDVWQALSQNIGSLVAFFDTLILNEHLPIIDYSFTFDSYL